MRIAFTGDLHSHEFKDYSRNINIEWDRKAKKFIETPKGKPVNSRLIDVLDTLIQMRDYCTNNDIKFLGISGDLFHKRGSISTIVYNLTYRVLESFKEAGISVFIEAGNHDQVSNEDIPENSLYGLKDLCKIITETETITLYDGKSKADILCIPYSKNSSLVLSPIVEFQPNEDIPTVLMTHVGVSGAYTGKTNYAMVDKLTPEDLHYEKFKYVVMGHFHKPQIIKGTDNMFYVGAPLQHNFNDEGEDRGFFIVDTSRRYDIRFIPLKSPKFITVKTQDDINDLDGNFIKISTTAKNVDDLMTHLEETLSPDQPIKIELQKEYVSEQRSDIDISMPYTEIIKTYAADKMPEALEIGLQIYAEAVSRE